MAELYHGDQSIGQRENQEDAFRIVRQSEDDPRSDLLLLVADGMGGHVGGEIASNLALKTFINHFISGSQSPRPSIRLREALLEANTAIAKRIQQEPELRGMGCTLLAALKRDDRLIWVSVGDSLLYRLRDGALQRLNADHSLMGELMESVRAQKMTLSEAKAHPRRNALRSAVTGEPVKLIDANSINMEKGDLIVLASDGLDTLNLDQIESLLTRNQKGDAGVITQGLLEKVKAARKPNQDNTTVVVYRHGISGNSALHNDSKWKFENSRLSQPFPMLLIGLAIGVSIAAMAIGFFVMMAPKPPAEPVEQVQTVPDAIEPTPIVVSPEDETPASPIEEPSQRPRLRPERIDPPAIEPPTDDAEPPNQPSTDLPGTDPATPDPATPDQDPPSVELEPNTPPTDGLPQVPEAPETQPPVALPDTPGPDGDVIPSDPVPDRIVD